jgi:hypothetical protein
MNALIFMFLFLMCVTVSTTNLTESQWEELEEQDEKIHQQWAENNYE